MRLISRATLVAYMENIDDMKMAYLMYLLKDDSKKGALFRPYLLALLTGGLTEKELIEMETEIKQGIQDIKN